MMHVPHIAFSFGLWFGTACCDVHLTPLLSLGGLWVFEEAGAAFQYLLTFRSSRSIVESTLKYNVSGINI